MKYIAFALAFSLHAQLFLAQITPKVRYLNVVSDKNVRENTDPKNCVSCSENDFIIDGNESRGYVELEFTGINNHRQPASIQLIMNIADVEYAESGDGFSVYYDNEKIGSIQNVARNKSFVIELTPSSIAKHDKIKLVLRGNGDDGLYILSKKSGFGAVLKLKY